MITAMILKYRKLIAVIIVIAVVAIYFTASTSNGWEEGAPEASITCNIRAAGDTITGSANVGDSTVLGQIAPLTSFTSNIDTLDANTEYTISFGATMTTKTAKFGESLTNSISVTGKTGGSKANLDYLDSAGTTTSSASVAGTAGASSSLSIAGFTKHSYNPSPVSIMGDVIDGSVFTFLISSTAPDGRAASTTATLTITVDNGGNIYLSVDNITVNLIESGIVPGDETTYPDGWNVPGNANYIVLSNFNTTHFVFNYEVLSTGNPGSSAPTTLAILKVLRLPQMLSYGYVSQTQYDCGMAQITAFGG